jgi:hypothetical protein
VLAIHQFSSNAIIRANLRRAREVFEKVVLVVVTCVVLCVVMCKVRCMVLFEVRFMVLFKVLFRAQLRTARGSTFQNRSTRPAVTLAAMVGLNFSITCSRSQRPARKADPN